MFYSPFPLLISPLFNYFAPPHFLFPPPPPPPPPPPYFTLLGLERREQESFTTDNYLKMFRDVLSKAVFIPYRMAFAPARKIVPYWDSVHT